jgi:uncharacterized membrane protein YsdA (DUF1294 family)/cold shock CspA family protein
MGRSRNTSLSGTVSSLDRTRGFGFLRSDDSERDIFFSLSDLPPQHQDIGVGSALRGKVTQTPKGPRLVSITVISSSTVSPHVIFGGLAVLISLALASAVAMNFEVTPLVAWLIGINCGAIFFMGLDKSLARSASLRTPETVTFVMALLGGSPGVLLGIHVFRHKTRKAAFQFVLLLIFAAQALLLRALGLSLRD